MAHHRILKILGIVSGVFIICFVLIAAYLMKHDLDGAPQQGECGGRVFIYTNNLVSSLELLKTNFNDKKWSTNFSPEGEYGNIVSVKFPYSIEVVDEFQKLVRGQASDKIIYGDKVLYEGFNDSIKNCSTYTAELHITDVKALKK
jgi:hypothetical protein